MIMRIQWREARHFHLDLIPVEYAKYNSIVANPPLKSITLKELSESLGLSKSTVSRILNGVGDAHRIAAETQQRVHKAAKRLGYSANTVARSLRQKRSYTIGVILPEISEGYSTAVLSGIEDELLKNEFFYLVVSHRHRRELLEGYSRMMLSRSVEGIIAIDTMLEEDLPVPQVNISGHGRRKDIISIELDHNEAARQALEHLKNLGHRRFAFIKGQSFSSDSAPRWQAIVTMAQQLEITIDPALVVELEGIEPGSGPGFAVTQQLLASQHPFTAIFAFNDVTAIGAIQALREAGLRVPRDVSVVGFDDVQIATVSQPALTTIHQPLHAMGQVAASTLLELIRGEIPEPHPAVLTVHPHLVVRKSTGRPPL
jgi:LacI family transcriptional regulator